ncbi:MAG: 2-oxo acid dehydrogenase subunit E2 [Ignavibacteriae bacterium]|nr:2-oxo acid dehydrogenase subunit E2 [Ignavibacteriota bacterium]
MRVDVLMPKMGESITEGRILKWVKKPGDAVDKDESILEIATDKVDTEVPSPASGILVEMFASEGETRDVGAVLAVIETDAAAAVVVESVSAAPASAASSAAPVETAAPQPASAPAPVVSTSEAPAVKSEKGARFYSPVVMRIAAENNLDSAELESIHGSGAGGRVTKSDILAWLEQRGSAPAAGLSPSPAASAPQPRPAPVPGSGVEVLPMSNMQRLMAEHMVESKRISPHVALAVDVDMTAVVRFRDANAAAFKQREGISLTFMPFVAEAAIQALKEHPLVNASVDGASILIKRFVNLGIAVALDDGGLIVPVVKHADALNTVGLARSIADVASRARKKRLQPEEIQDGTFTITNFGVFGSTWGIPIINQPQVAILGVGTMQKKPVVLERDGEDVIAVRSMMTLTLSFDHRIVDGALGGKYLESLKRILESFEPAAI